MFEHFFASVLLNTYEIFHSLRKISTNLIFELLKGYHYKTNNTFGRLRKGYYQNLWWPSYTSSYFSFVAFTCVLLFYARTSITMSNSSDGSRFLFHFFLRKAVLNISRLIMCILCFSVDSFYQSFPLISSLFSFCELILIIIGIFPTLFMLMNYINRFANVEFGFAFLEYAQELLIMYYSIYILLNFSPMFLSETSASLPKAWVWVASLI